jgi:hypothetical protein
MVVSDRGKVSIAARPGRGVVDKHMRARAAMRLENWGKSREL